MEGRHLPESCCHGIQTRHDRPIFSVREVKIDDYTQLLEHNRRTWYSNMVSVREVKIDDWRKYVRGGGT